MGWRLINGAYLANVEPDAPKTIPNLPLVNADKLRGYLLDASAIGDGKAITYDADSGNLVYRSIVLSGDINMSGSVITNIGIGSSDNPTSNSSCNIYFDEDLEKLYFIVKDSGGDIVNFSINPDEDLSLNAKLASHRFPKLANQIQECPKQTTAVWNDLHLMDLAVIDASIAFTDPDFMDKIRLQNPHIVILSYITFADIIPNATENNQNFIYQVYTGMDSGWWLKDIAGGIVKLDQISGSTYTLMRNHTVSAFQDYFASTIQSLIIDPGYFDGIYYDNVMPTIAWLDSRSPMPPAPGDQGIDINNDTVHDTGSALNNAWVAGAQQSLDKADFGFRMRNAIWGDSTGTTYATYLNGIMIEQFMEGPTTQPGSYSWNQQMRNYAYNIVNGRSPHVGLIMQNDSSSVASVMRFAMCSAMMFDGYFCSTNRTGAYVSNRWFDEYGVIDGTATKSLEAKGYLGEAQGAAYNTASTSELLYDSLLAGTSQTKTWRRDFENGIVLVNPTTGTVNISLGGSFKKILGNDSFNDGSTITSIALPTLSGAVLLRT